MSNQLARVNDAPNAQLTQLTPMQPTDLAITPEKKDLLKRTICKGASDDELELALAICGRMKLDPFAKQIAFIKRWDSRENREVMTAQPTIDGARLLAQRSASYGGQLGPWWCGQDGQWAEVWLGEGEPIAAKVGVINLAFKEPLFAVAKFSSYAAKKKDGKLMALWAQMPDLMIAKCAEMLALRRAFPAEFSDFGGVDFGAAEDVGQMVTEAAQYIEVDGVVADAATGELVQHDEVKTQPRHSDTMKRLHVVAANRGLSHDDVHALAIASFGVQSMTELDIPQLARLAEWVETLEMERLQAGIAKAKAATELVADEPVTIDDIPFETDPASPIPDFLKMIRAATTEKALNMVTQQMQAIGVWAPEVTTAVVDKRNDLGLIAPKQAAQLVDAPLMQAGEPGANRHTD